MDMDDTQREQAGISGKSEDRHPGLLFDFNGPPGSSMCYLDQEHGIREQYWISRVREQKVSSAIMICSLMHLSPLSTKVRKLGWIVEELNVCEMEWHIANFGTVKVVEDQGQRRCESRPPAKKSGV
jgi:hypothetical protein